MITLLVLLSFAAIVYLIAAHVPQHTPHTSTSAHLHTAGCQRMRRSRRRPHVGLDCTSGDCRWPDDLPTRMATMAGLDVLNSIIDYEAGNLSDDDTIALFQSLVNSGMAWQLQGSYGRTAQSMIARGLITLPKGSAS